MASLAWLAGVPRPALEAVLALHWGAQAADLAARRLAAYRAEAAIRATARRRQQPSTARTGGVRELVDAIRRDHPALTLEDAFERVAAQRHLAWGTVRNAYYRKSPRLVAVTTETSSGDGVARR